MTLAELSIRRPVFAWILMIALILFGAFAFVGLGISQLPDVDFPVVNVNLSYTGAAPEVLESSVVDPIEDAVMGIEGVKRVSSSSTTGSANVTIEFDINRNIDLALNDVQAKVEQARRSLPTDLDPPVITKTNPDDQPILWLALTAPGLTLNQMGRYVRDTLKAHFTTIEGVGDITLGGYVEPNLRVWVNPKELRAYQLTIGDVVSAIQAEHFEPPSGYLTYGRNEFDVRTLGETESAAALSKVYINTRGGQPNFAPIPLSRLATVEEGTEDIRRIARSDGKPAMGLGILKRRGANAVAVARAVKAGLPEIRKTLPPGAELEVRSDTTRFIEDAVSELNFTLLLSAILTALVCWAFLGSWSATLNVLLAIPTSIVGSFIVLNLLGFTLNTFTLLALSLSIGIVVDDAIMVLENIVRHRELGEPRVRAAYLGTRQITFAAAAATFSILAIFLPVAFMRGVIGRFFYQFGMTMAVAVLLSLLEALTLTPMRTSQFLEVKERSTRFGRWIETTFDRMRDLYSRMLRTALRHRLLVIAASLVIFVLSMGLLRKINKEFLPAEDQSQFLLRIKTPLGSSIDYTSDRFRQIENFLLSRPEVSGIFSAIGGFGGGQVNQGFVFVNMKPKGKRGKNTKLGRELSQGDLMSLCRRELNRMPGIQAFAQDLSARGFSSSRGFPIELTLSGPDWNTLTRKTQEFMAAYGKTGLVTDVDTDYPGESPELAIVPNRPEAEKRGVSIQSVGEIINAAIGGIRVAKYTSQGRRFDIRVKLKEDPALEKLPPVQRLSQLTVRNNRGELIPLLDVSQVVRRPAPLILTRVDRQRAVTVFANVAPGKSQQAALDKALEISRSILPPGYQVQPSGTSQTFQESFRSLGVALALGVLVAYMILAVQFESFVDPITVLMALPFSITGAFVALKLTGQSLNIYSMIGLILLMGIVKKNSILLIDFTRQVRGNEELPVPQALLKACPIRLRPIVMTSIASIAGALPAALAFGPGSETRKPMAIAVIGGVLLSTILTLFVVPCVYTFLSGKSLKKPQELDRWLAAASIFAVCVGGALGTGCGPRELPRPQPGRAPLPLPSRIPVPSSHGTRQGQGHESLPK